jgi:hypothetical protein
MKYRCFNDIMDRPWTLVNDGKYMKIREWIEVLGRRPHAFHQR